MERNRRKMLASVGWDLTGFRHWRSQCHEIDRRSMSVAVIVSCNGWIDFQCVVLRVCGKIMREWLSWWSTTLPRLGSRVRVPSRALKNKKKDIQKRISFFVILKPAGRKRRGVEASTPSRASQSERPPDVLRRLTLPAPLQCCASLNEELPDVLRQL